MSASPNAVVPALRPESPRPIDSALGLVRRQDERNTAIDEPMESANGFNDLLFELGIEPALTVKEAATVLRWSYWKARRYFRDIDGICLCCRSRRYKRPYRTFTIPLSILAREWQKMTGQQPESVDAIRQRVASIIRK